MRNLVDNIGLVGADPRRPALHFERMYRDNQWTVGTVGTVGTVAVSAISALDIAMWDIKGKELGRPIYELFGGPTLERVPVYCHVPARATPQEYADNIGAAVARGYRVMKTTIPVYYGQAHKVSRDGARDDYGVVVTGPDDAPTADLDATDALRERLRDERGEPAFFDRGPGFATLHPEAATHADVDVVGTSRG